MVFVTSSFEFTIDCVTSRPSYFFIKTSHTVNHKELCLLINYWQAIMKTLRCKITSAVLPTAITLFICSKPRWELGTNFRSNSFWLCRRGQCVDKEKNEQNIKDLSGPIFSIFIIFKRIVQHESDKCAMLNTWNTLKFSYLHCIWHTLLLSWMFTGQLTALFVLIF